MNKQLVVVPGHRDHPPQPVPASHPVRRVGMLDRAALHLGVALITWGRRPARRPAVEISRESVETARQIDELRNKYLLWGSDLTRLR